MSFSARKFFDETYQKKEGKTLGQEEVENAMLLERDINESAEELTTQPRPHGCNPSARTREPDQFRAGDASIGPAAKSGPHVNRVWFKCHAL